MHRTGLFLGLILSTAIGAAACSRTAEEREQQQEAALKAHPGEVGDEVTITGCLASAPDRGAFVLTASRDALTSGALYAGDGETPTYTYELSGNVSDLGKHVGRQVEVTGQLADRDDEVKVDQEEETELPERQSGDEKVTPAIETDTEMNINVRRLEVKAVNETGRPCQSNDGRQ